jgi:small subunit ribosomal protein S27e
MRRKWKLKKERISIPQPKSVFLLVKCQKCDNEQIIYSMTNTNIYCKVCEEKLSENTGGKSKIDALILRRLD